MVIFHSYVSLPEGITFLGLNHQSISIRGWILRNLVFTASVMCHHEPWVMRGSAFWSFYWQLSQLTLKKKHHWLVVDLPLWNIWVRQLGWLFHIIPNIWKNPSMFQTTNQISNCCFNHQILVMSHRSPATRPVLANRCASRWRAPP